MLSSGHLYSFWKSRFFTDLGRAEESCDNHRRHLIQQNQSRPHRITRSTASICASLPLAAGALVHDGLTGPAPNGARPPTLAPGGGGWGRSVTGPLAHPGPARPSHSPARPPATSPARPGPAHLAAPLPRPEGGKGGKERPRERPEPHLTPPRHRQSPAAGGRSTSRTHNTPPPAPGAAGKCSLRRLGDYSSRRAPRQTAAPGLDYRSQRAPLPPGAALPVVPRGGSRAPPEVCRAASAASRSFPRGRGMAGAAHCSLQAKRLLLDPKFEGYKLSLEPLACYQLGLDAGEEQGWVRRRARRRGGGGAVARPAPRAAGEGTGSVRVSLRPLAVLGGPPCERGLRWRKPSPPPAGACAPLLCRERRVVKRLGVSYRFFLL